MVTHPVGIVIVSHSPKIAEGAADMVRQMVGDSVNLAYTGGDPVVTKIADMAQTSVGLFHGPDGAEVSLTLTDYNAAGLPSLPATAVVKLDASTLPPSQPAAPTVQVVSAADDSAAAS